MTGSTARRDSQSVSDERERDVWVARVSVVDAG